jgi:hypothetical protein
MTDNSEPTFSDWRNLGNVVLNVEDIISLPTSDGPPGYELVRDMRLNSRSTVDMRLRQSTRRVGFLLRKELDVITKSVDELIPNLDQLGSTREVRLASLKAFLPNLKAYRWLNEHDSYKRAIRTIARLKKTNPIYAGDTSEFLLIQVFLWPLILLLLQRKHKLSPAYPTKKELAEGLKGAQNLLALLIERTPIHGLVTETKALISDLERYAEKVELMRKTYRKPVDDGFSAERDFRDQVIRNLLENAGGCSTTLVSHILTLVNFPHDIRDLQRQIKTMRLEGPRRSRPTLLTGDTGG